MDGEAYSNDLRERAVEAIAEDATREEAAERHCASLSRPGVSSDSSANIGSFGPADFGGYPNGCALESHEERVIGGGAPG
jgi:hypothetical protein